ncbi:MAG: putative membrane protein YedE/YeeE [Glaciecola sp.]|jgi:uncharacterized membrane protein YedE/YeeE
MNLAKYLITGIFFGIILSKGEAISWYRIFEMFHFDAFHMYGIIGSAVIIGIFSLQVIKKRKLKSANQTTIEIKDKDKSITRYIVGGTLFGLGWALIGACPGPLFILIGYGYLTIGVVIVGALMGTFVYGLLKTRLPH